MCMYPQRLALQITNLLLYHSLQDVEGLPSQGIHDKKEINKQKPSKGKKKLIILPLGQKMLILMALLNHLFNSSLSTSHTLL